MSDYVIGVYETGLGLVQAGVIISVSVYRDYGAALLTYTERLGLLERFRGFIEGDRVDEFIRVFGVRLASGTWVAGDYADRFMRTGYNPGMGSGLIERVERVRRAGIDAVVPVNTEFLDERLEVVWPLVDRLREYVRENNMTIASLAVDLSGIPLFKKGSITNTDRGLRRRALELVIESMEVAKRLDTDTVSFWPGQDGWDYSLEVDYGEKIRLFLDGLRELAGEARSRGLYLAIEAKPKEPREGNMILPTTHAAALVASRINSELGEERVGLTIDYGHELMYAVEPAYTVYLTHVLGVPLFSIHINSSKTHSNDEDRVVGTGDVWQLVDFLYATIDTGYRGYYVLDEFPYRMDPVEAMRISRTLFVNMMRRALELYRVKRELEETRGSDDQARILWYVARIVLG